MPGTYAQAFDLPDNVIYLNTAAVGPRLHTVQAAARDALARSARPWTVTTKAWLDEGEGLRDTAAALLGTTADGLAFIPSASYGIALAARNLPPRPGQRIVLLSGEYPSNRNIWLHEAALADAEVVDAAPDEDGSWTAAVLQHIDEDTGTVCVPHCYWRDGAPVDLVAIGERCRAAGAALIIDASQSLGVWPLDFARIQPDFVVSAGFKWLLGAPGLNWLWASPHWREHGQALEQSWLQRVGREGIGDMPDALTPQRPGARRFDAGGSLHPLNVPMTQAALDQVALWGVDNIRGRLQALLDHLAARLAARGLADWLVSPHAPHLCALRPPADRLSHLAQTLSAAGIQLSRRGAVLRIAPYLHIGEDDINTLVDHLAAA